MSVERTISVMVVDDQTVYHQMVTRILAGQGDMAVVAVAATVQEALDGARQHRPDVVLMDQQLPDGKGTDAAKRIAAGHHGARIVMVTSTADDRTLAAARKAGCSGYVLKDRLLDDLPAAIRAAHRGETALPASGVELFMTPLITGDDASQ